MKALKIIALFVVLFGISIAVAGGVAQGWYTTSTTSTYSTSTVTSTTMPSTTTCPDCGPGQQSVPTDTTPTGTVPGQQTTPGVSTPPGQQTGTPPGQQKGAPPETTGIGHPNSPNEKAGRGPLPKELAFTGIDAGAMALVGGLLLLAGLALPRRRRLEQ